MNIIKKYTGKSLWLAGLMLTTLMAGCSGGGGSSSTVPTVVETTPASSATGVALNSKVTATFSEAMDESTITPESFTVTDASGTPLSGILEYDAESKTAVFDANTNFEASTDYTAKVTTMATSAAGIPLATEHVWTFTTGIVVETQPAPGATGVLLNSKVIITFSEAMDPATITTSGSFIVTGPNESLLTGTVVYDAESKAAVFDANLDFLPNTLYTATVSTAVTTDAPENTPLAADYVWSFTTGVETDSTAPTVESTNPADSETGVPLNRSVSANFSEKLDSATITASAFTLNTGPVAGGGTSVGGDVSYSEKVATFTPAINLTASTVYTASLTTGIEDLAGNALALNKVWSFTTGDSSTVAQGPAPVNLRTAGDFVILTKAGITNTDSHLSDITGNIGTSPITAAAMDNVWCSEITGVIYGVDPAYTGSSDVSCFEGDAAAKTYVDTAVLDMGTAYADAAGRTGTDFTELHAGNLSGKTLTPGLYKWSNSVLINTGDVTLNGGANDVWIFQIAGNVTQASNTHVFLTGGALAKNVFWQVAGDEGVTIGTGAVFQGVVLARTKVAANTAAKVVHGRLFAHTAVTLQGNEITKPAP